MKVRLVLPLISAALIAGCGEEPPVPSRADTAAALAQQKARIDALAEGQRNAVFLRAIRDGGQDCQQVLGSAYNGDQFGRPAWTARCSDGRDWTVMVEANGRALVARREEAPRPR